MKFTAEQIAGVLGGEVIGNPNAEVYKLSKIEEGSEGSISFLANPKYLAYIYTTKATITIVNSTFVPDAELSTTLIKVEDAYLSFTKLLEFYDQARKANKSGIEQPSFLSDSVKYGANLYLGSFSYIGENVVLGENVKIYPNCFIGDNVVMGDNITIFAGAKVHSETVIGNNCVIYSGAVIGADGFGFAPNTDGTFTKIPQIGNVIIGHNVEIGANSCIDRGKFSSTVLGNGCKIDNLVQIGHNSKLGMFCIMAGNSGLAGSVTLGNGVIIGGSASIKDHTTIGDGAIIGAGSGVTGDVEAGKTMLGYPAIDAKDALRQWAILKRMVNDSKK